MLRREKLLDQTNAGFKVVPGREEAAHNFLRVIDRASNMPVQFTDGSFSLPLGSVDTHNTLIHIVAAHLNYLPGGNYETVTSFLTNQEVPQHSGIRSIEIDRLDPRSVIVGLMRGDLELPFNSPQGVGNQDDVISLVTLSETLRRRPYLAKYKIGLSDDTDSIEIAAPKALDGQVQDFDYTLHRAPLERVREFGGVLYQLGSLKNPIETDPMEFAKKYRLYAKLIEEVALSFYQIHGTQSPNVTLEFAPTDEAIAGFKRTENMLEMQRRQLTAAGLLDDEGYDDEIAKHIIMERPKIRFVDIGGQKRAKTELSDVVAGLISPEEFYAEGAEPPSGVMLYGPSGTGKTLLARGTAGEAGVALFSVGLASILHSLWGKTERYIQRIFDQATEQAPAIIFLDEIDAIARQRSSLNTAYSSIVNTLLTNMDGMRERPRNVVVIGATNLLDLVDDALLRPGRFDLLVPVGLPGKQGRAEVFRIHQAKALQRALRPAEEIFDPSFDLDKFVAATKGLTGADIKEILRRSLVERVRLKRKGSTVHPLTADDLISQIIGYEPIRKDKAVRDAREERRVGFKPTSVEARSDDENDF